MFLVGSSPRQSIPSIDAPIISSSDGEGVSSDSFWPHPRGPESSLASGFWKRFQAHPAKLAGSSPGISHFSG